MPGFPEWGTVSIIEPSPFDAGTAYVVVDAHRLDDMRPYLYKTSDFGKIVEAARRRAAAGRLPARRPRGSRRSAASLYLGTERGVMFSTDDGRWRPLQLNLPTVAVHDLRVKDDDLVVGTHGRSLWILDDLQPIREYNDRVAAAAVHSSR